ncbi:flavohemoglobin expression-modulating QEGLA motif protein [Hyphomicrobium sp. CS1GBMeth3]|uniref:flavohemoglobin expression-modulating QEGLA motif protein n=1 Tax=Hyphomicrobium sp. CS1GBMeth3 TaxID=1892845 RepID=UPI0009315359|nr:flavohemoglobin expression-modulating QEGLA motif protein [Hyphomicrobium sp. CS1GBMeth3]
MSKATTTRNTNRRSNRGGELEAGRFIRTKLGAHGRMHVDRALPFICLHIRTGETAALAAEQLATAQASHIVVDRFEDVASGLADFTELMGDVFGACLLIELLELSEDRRLKDDDPSLPTFEIDVACNERVGAADARDAFSNALRGSKMRYRRPQVVKRSGLATEDERFEKLTRKMPFLRIGIAPIYRQPSTEQIYPELLEQLVAHLYDALLKAVYAFAYTATSFKPRSHRALGRKIVIDGVRRVDRQMDAICSSFDFLVDLTPINTEEAWETFRHQRFAETPNFHYRPLTFDVGAKKRELFSISLDQLEDPTLTKLFDEKRREIDLQLTLLNERGTERAKDVSRVMYGPVEPELKSEAEHIIRHLDAINENRGFEDDDVCLDAHHVRMRAEQQISRYRRRFEAFSPSVEIRADMPAGLMVSGPRLLISRTTAVPKHRVEAILNHEVGVHLLTYFNGQEQGLRLLRSGLAGYEEMQEGLAVFAEYASGGLTRPRLRLLAARVLGCEAMLAGADFMETFNMLTEHCGLTSRGAFHAAMRVHRSGGLAKDAIYLRGLMQVLHHLREGGALDVFWIGKIASRHFPFMTELLDRGLLKAIPLVPDFVSVSAAKRRIATPGSVLSPIDLMVH